MVKAPTTSAKSNKSIPVVDESSEKAKKKAKKVKRLEKEALLAEALLASNEAKRLQEAAEEARDEALQAANDETTDPPAPTKPVQTEHTGDDRDGESLETNLPVYTVPPAIAQPRDKNTTNSLPSTGSDLWSPLSTMGTKALESKAFTSFDGPASILTMPQFDQIYSEHEHLFTDDKKEALCEKTPTRLRHIAVLD